MNKIYPISLVALVLLLAMAIASCPTNQSQETGTETALTPPTADAGGKAPAKGGAAWTGDVKDFNFTRFDGKPGKLSEYAGQPLVVNFWAAWCPPCKAEMPDMQEVYQAHAGQFKMLGVAVDERQDPKALVVNEGFSWDFASDGGGSSLYSIDAIPTTLFIDRQGNIVKRITGMASREEFEAGLSLIL